MSRELRVYLDGVPIGILTQNNQGALGFGYHDDYLERSQPTPLSLSMPLRAGTYSPRVVRAFLDGLLPDNQAVRERWGREFGVSPNNPFALLQHVGRDAAGAVQILPASGSSDDAVIREGAVGWLSGDEFVVLVRELAQHRRDWAAGRVTGRWSLAGAQSKVALYRDPVSGAWGIPRDSTPTTHIVKPAIEGFDDHHINEVLVSGQPASSDCSRHGLSWWKSAMCAPSSPRATTASPMAMVFSAVFTRRISARRCRCIRARSTRVRAVLEWAP